MSRKKKTIIVSNGVGLAAANLMFYIGVVAMVATLVLLFKNGKMGIAAYVAAALAVVGTAGGMMFAMVHVKCPHCHESLLQGTLLPLHLPKICPHCGQSTKE
ncbi:MAG: hypothetical protein E7445_03010 [Ruminococcaceae bacterium]|nr:hypothetical protein [Oscillospiraceae bacterium]